MFRMVSSVQEQKEILKSMAAWAAEPMVAKKSRPQPHQSKPRVRSAKEPRVVPTPQPIQWISPTPTPTPQKPQIRGHLSRQSQADRLKERCQPREGGHLVCETWTHQEPIFQLDGKPTPISQAAFALWHTLQRVPQGKRVAPSCRVFNCLAREHLALVDQKTARAMTKPSEFDVAEYFRLKSLGNSDEQIADLISHLSPKEIHKIGRGL